jgi:NitT/TauT family transport system ATP-binding protein
MAMEAADAFVDIREVGLVYNQDGDEKPTPAIESVSLTIREGEFVAVVGPSGCGKSSLMKLVTGLIPPTRGRIFVAGEEVVKPINGVGMAFQNSTLMPWRTTLENIMLPLEIVKPYKHRFRRARKEFTTLAENLLASVGLRGFGDKYPWQLSGGMQQRANLCRAIIHEPSLLMLDEPFGALDAFTREDLWGSMQALWMARHFTAVLVTHDLREAVYLADTVYVMSDRPGNIILTKRVNLPRPRTLAMTFSPGFVEIVQQLRERITEVRTL